MTQILDSQADFKVMYGSGVAVVCDPPDHHVAGDNTANTAATIPYSRCFALAGDLPPNTANRGRIIEALYPLEWYEQMGHFCEDTMRRLLHKHSLDLPVIATSTAARALSSREVDVVRDIFSLCTTRLMAAIFSLPLKLDDAEDERHHLIQGRDGSNSVAQYYSEQKLYAVLAAGFDAILVPDPANTFRVQLNGRATMQQLGRTILSHTRAVAAAGRPIAPDRGEGAGPGKGAAASRPALAKFGDAMILRLLGSGRGIVSTVWGTILPLSAAGAINETRAITQCLDYYLGDGKEHLAELYRLAHENTRDADSVLTK